MNKFANLFILVLGVIILFVIYWAFAQIDPLVSYDYAFICKDEIEYEMLIMKISKLEGMVVVMQRTIPVYGGLIVAIILFLTWKQQDIAKSTALIEINDNFKVYKERIKELESQAQNFVDEIKAKHNALLGIEDLKITDILEHYSKKKKDGH
ncbi:MAG: hypothetical protein AAGA77_15260 [Bacteroidota bacterium]